MLHVVKKPLMVSKINFGINRNILQMLDLWGTETEPEEMIRMKLDGELGNLDSCITLCSLVTDIQ